MSDQFVGRDKWVGIKTRADILFQKKEINGVYLGADRYLIGVNDPKNTRNRWKIPGLRP